MPAYYNEIDPFCAEWLRNLVAAGHIASGDVDERDIRLVQPDDVRGYEQCHWFAGIGTWSHALRLAGWEDTRPAWSASCPCQPFSAAGRGMGADDERHLWPAFHRLVAERRPPVVLGEQVASAAGRSWLAAVRADLEDVGYAVGAADLCAAGVGAPHIRQRLYWVADAAISGKRTFDGEPREGVQPQEPFGGCCLSGQLADADEPRPQGRNGVSERPGERLAGAGGVAGGMADADGERRIRLDALLWPEEGGRDQSTLRQVAGGSTKGERPGPPHGFWRDADWLLCRDGRWRPVKPGLEPLVDGTDGRVGKLRAFGNAIVAPLAAEFIAAVMECAP